MDYVHSGTRGNSVPTTVRAEIQADTLEKLAACRPLQALAGVIWNGFDADANRIDIEISRNSLDEIDAIRVIDNGHGMEFAETLEVFRKFGGSLKKSKQRSRTQNRMLHGGERPLPPPAWDQRCGHRGGRRRVG